jgi:hypothetical protein
MKCESDINQNVASFSACYLPYIGKNYLSEQTLGQRECVERTCIKEQDTCSVSTESVNNRCSNKYILDIYNKIPQLHQRQQTCVKVVMGLWVII